MDERTETLLKAIREKCLDCCCDDVTEVQYCAWFNCALHPFRLGNNPYASEEPKRKK